MSRSATRGYLASSEAIYSAYVSRNSPVFRRILELYVPAGARVADVTYGRGTFWKEVPHGKYELLASDIQTGVDCRDLPYANESIDALVLDPPYMEGMFREAHQQPLQHGDFRARYSQSLSDDSPGPKYHQRVLALYESALVEALRVLKPRGIAIVKCQDEVSNHRQWFTHVEILLAMQEGGFRMEDLFVVVRPDRPSVGRIKKQVHARKRHSYFLVGRKTRRPNVLHA